MVWTSTPREWEKGCVGEIERRRIGKHRKPCWWGEDDNDFNCFAQWSRLLTPDSQHPYLSDDSGVLLSTEKWLRGSSSSGFVSCHIHFMEIDNATIEFWWRICVTCSTWIILYDQDCYNSSRAITLLSLLMNRFHGVQQACTIFKPKRWLVTVLVGHCEPLSITSYSSVSCWSSKWLFMTVTPLDKHQQKFSTSSS